ncbi:tripartite motif-containing protein 2-like [Saccostrea cucullata]|uniref:tripartite motif-containing protein 2-like n=1 Tax=Saccostrea cuccullata TaxID=36930 RepID=UPI002ED12599
MCSDHDLEILNLYCRTCDKLVCTDCVLKKHKSHDWCKVRDIADEKRASLSKNTKLAHEKTLPKMNHTLQDVEHIAKENQRKKTETLRNIEKQSTAILTNVRKMETKLKEALEQSFQSYIEAERELREDFRDLSGLTKECEKILQRGTDSEVITANCKLEKYIKQVHELDIETFKSESSFQTGKIDSNTLENMFGQINLVRRKGQTNTEYIPNIVIGEKKAFSYTKIQDDISSICSLGNRIWLHPRGSTDNFALDHNGNLLSVKDFGVVVSYGFAKSQDGCLLCVDFVGKVILKLSGDGRLSKVINTDPLKPLSICMTREGQYLACLEDSTTNGHTKTGHCRVFRLSISGRIIQSIGARLFNMPRKVAENTNADICVIDRVPDQNSRLYVLSSSGVLKFEFSTQSPWDVCCDQYSNIIVISRHCSDVTILDKNGLHLETFSASDKFKSALSVSMDSDSIWVSGTNGCVAKIEITYS